MHLEKISSPADLRALNPSQLTELCSEIRSFIVDAVSRTGGHLGSNLGAVELTVAVHRVFESPRDVIVWDTGHQAYVHKLLTGRRDDAWLAKWSRAEAAVPLPVDPIQLADAVVGILRKQRGDRAG